MSLIGASASQAALLLGNGSPNPADSGLVLWLDSSDASTLFQDTAGTTPAAAGQPVARWDDKSLSGISVQQGSVGNSPSFSTGIGNFGGANAVSFVGGANGDALSSTTGNSTGIIGANASLTMITVYQTTGFTAQNYQHSLHIGIPAASQAYGHSVSRANNLGQLSNHYWAAGFDSTGIAPLNTAHLGLSTYDGITDTDSFFFDGTAAGTNVIGLNIGGDQLQIGSRLSPFTEGFTGDLAEVIIFNSVLSDNDRNLLGGYIQNKYGLTIDGAIPEPSTTMLVLLGMIGFLSGRRRR